MPDSKNTLFNSSPYKNQIWALIYFSLAISIGSWFIHCVPLASDQSKKELSNIISIGKWFIQIIVALIFLKEERWIFIRQIGFVDLFGSFLLLPFIVLSELDITKDQTFYNFSLLLSIMVMIFIYYRVVTQNNLKLFWWFFWIICQVTALLLQITVVFQAF